MGGMTLGADPLVSSVTVVSHLEGYPLPGFIIRKQPKGHGTNQYLEGLNNFQPGMNVCLLEDVITTGGTLLKAVDRVREQGLNIVAIMGVLDREQAAAKNIAQAGFELRTTLLARNWSKRPEVDAVSMQLCYCSRLSTCCGSALACASIAVPACCRICAFVRLAVSAAKSVSWMRYGSVERFS